VFNNRGIAEAKVNTSIVLRKIARTRHAFRDLRVFAGGNFDPDSDTIAIAFVSAKLNLEPVVCNG
jgi:hypothetical protein